jgi:D-aspartate ligase
VVENYDPIAAFSYWRGGELGLRSWLASLRAVDETAWFAGDDLRPFGLMCLRMGWRMATRRLALPQGRAPSADFRFSRGRASRAGQRPAAPGTTKISTRRPAEPQPRKEGTKV